MQNNDYREVLDAHTQLVAQTDTSIAGIDLGLANFGTSILTGYPRNATWAVRASECFRLSPWNPLTREQRVSHQQQNLRSFLQTHRDIPLAGIVAEGDLPIPGNVHARDSIGYLSLAVTELAEQLQLPILFVNAKITKRLLTDKPNAPKAAVATAIEKLTQFRHADNSHINDATAMAYVGFYASGAIRNTLHFPLEREVVVVERKRFVYEVTTLRRFPQHHPQGEQLDWLTPRQ